MKLITKKDLIRAALAVAMSAAVLGVIAEASTTISTDITTGGNLTVSGVTSLQAATTTAFFATTASSTNLSAANLTLGGAAILRHLSATQSLDFPVVAGSSCQSLTMTVNNAADGDTVYLGVPNALASASTTFTLYGFVSAANTVTVRLCQVSTQGSSDPAAATIRADVWKH